jgi:adenylate cyclase class 2
LPLREVEVKYRVLDLDVLVSALADCGVDLGNCVMQDDQAYAPVSWQYGQPRIGVPFARLRTVAGQHVFTVKRPAENVLSCEEHESTVADREEMHQALVAMGFRATQRIRKTRRCGTALAGAVSVCVDEVDGLGVFLELERMVPDGVPGDVIQAGLAEFAGSLGVAAERVEDTYDALIRAAAPA